MTGKENTPLRVRRAEPVKRSPADPHNIATESIGE
jgi:hypothetical protein